VNTVKRFTRNIISNTAGYCINIIIAFFFFSFLVSQLGDQIFGLWTLVVSLNGYYGLLDLGVRSAVGQYVTRYLSIDDYKKANHTFNTAFFFSLCMALFVLIVCFVVSQCAGQWFSLSIENAHKARWAILIMGCGVAISLPGSLFSVATYARQRFDIANGVAISITIVSKTCIVLVLCAQKGLIGIACVTAATAIIQGIIRAILAFKLVPQLRITFRYVSLQSARELMGYGLLNSLVNIADRIITHLDALVIGFFMSTVTVTYYAIGANLIPYYISIINAVAFTFTPHATSCDARGDREGLRLLFLNGTRWIVLYASLIGASMIFLGKDFLRLWMGDRFISGENFPPSSLILSILTVAALFRLGMSCGKQICFGIREIKFLALLTFCEAFCNIILSIILVKPYGLIGVALGTLIPIVIAYGIVEPLYVLKKLHLQWNQFYLHVGWGALTALATMALVFYTINPYMHANTWFIFFLKAVICFVPSLITGLLIGTTPSEKKLLFEKQYLLKMRKKSNQ